MADVMDLPPEPLPRDDRRRELKDKPLDDRRRDKDRRDEKGIRDVSKGRDDKDDRPPRLEKDDRPPRRDHGIEKRDKDKDPRDHKRRKSPSPPPYGRDRRHSPSYKRTKRDDDDIDMGRGVLLSGRYNYDMVSGRGDDRSHGRHNSSRANWPGTGRGGSNDSNAAGGRRDGLMTYKQFIVELEDDILPAEAERRYEEYKTEYISTQKRTYFEQHKDDDSLREKYDPSRLEAVLARRIENARNLAKEFQSELYAGSLDLGPNALGNKSRADGDPMSDDDQDGSLKRRKPSRKDNDLEAAPRAPALSSDPKRISKDIDQARALIRKLDAEKGIQGNVLVQNDQQGVDADGSVGPIVIVRGINQVKGYEGIELLDVLITYLWRVHGLDYYGVTELKESPKGLRHMRAEGKTGETVNALDWEKKLDLTWENRLQGQDPVEAMLGKEKLESVANAALDPLVRKIRDEKYGWKYGCGAKGCTKLFHGPEFVHKHLKLKHSDMVSDVVAKSREELYFQNYMNDPNAPGATGSYQSQRDRARKRRGGASGSGSDRGLAPGKSGRDLERSDRERDRGGHEDDRGDRSGEKSPGQDFNSAPSYDGAGTSGQFEGGPGDFDPFNNSGMRPVYSPPPVLMPVPGAGPLGPFVPAPREVAMRMWRDGSLHQGSYDSSFDGESNGGSRGRRGQESAPMILPIPALRQDPRRMRSYHDLDAPEDEVTVIDYREL